MEQIIKDLLVYIEFQSKSIITLSDTATKLQQQIIKLVEVQNQLNLRLIEVEQRQFKN